MALNGIGMGRNSSLGNTMKFRTKLRPKTGSPKIQRDALVCAMGMKRVKEYKDVARSRADSNMPRSWFSDEGLVEFADQFVLGQKGGKWADPEHIMCARPGRESTPPMFCTRHPRRSSRGVPGALNAAQMQIATRRLCEKLSRPELRSLMTKLGASVGEGSSICSEERSALFKEAEKSCARLPFRDLKKLCGEFGFEMCTQWAHIQEGAGCQQIGATWPSTCLGTIMQSTTDSLHHTQEDQRPPPTPGEPTYLWDPEYQVSKPQGGLLLESKRRPHSVAAPIHLPSQESSLRAWHHTAVYTQPPGSKSRAPLMRVHKKSGAINSSSKNREWNKWDFSGTSDTGGVCTRSEDVRARTSIPRGRLSPNTLTWGLEVR